MCSIHVKVLKRLGTRYTALQLGFKNKIIK